MSPDPVTPEEKLLKIIENPQGPKPRPSITERKGGSPSIKDLDSLFKGFQMDPDIAKYITLPFINKAMAAVCVIITIFFVVNYIIVGNALDKRYSQLALDAKAVSAEMKKSSVPEMSFLDIAQGARKRNMFTALPINPGAQAAVSAEAAQVITNFKVVGIIWSDSPQAMIEDEKEKKTYLLNVGEYAGQYKVNAILRNKVVLGKDGQEWELR